MSKISGFRASNWSREVLGGVPEAYLSDHRRVLTRSTQDGAQPITGMCVLNEIDVGPLTLTLNIDS